MSPAPRFDFAAPAPDLADLGRLHFVSIGGAGMSGVARVALARGTTVSGCDVREVPVLAALAAEGATVAVGHDPAHLDAVDTVVISSAVRDTNPELVAARDRGLAVLHRSQALAATMTTSRRVAVAGANGKTTTTSMLTVALQAAGADPSFAIGGELAGRGTNAHWGSGEVFVAEADESDGSFLVYRPEVAVVTNVQPDHLDFYGTFEQVRAAYAEFAASVTGTLVACFDDEGSRALAEHARDVLYAEDARRVVTYGFGEGADVRLSDERAEGLRASARVALPDAGEVLLQLPVPGHHNLLNAAAALVAATTGLGHDLTATLDGLAGFLGTRRRFEVRGEAGGVTVVDDYAHNPGKVDAVVSTAASIVRARGGRLVVVFQPHLYSRTRDFAVEFARGLSGADELVLMEVYGAREDPLPGVSSALIADADPLADTPSRLVSSWSEVATAVADLARPGDLVLTVGAGDVTMVGPEILRELAERSATGPVAP